MAATTGHPKRALCGNGARPSQSLPWRGWRSRVVVVAVPLKPPSSPVSPPPPPSPPSPLHPRRGSGIVIIVSVFFSVVISTVVVCHCRLRHCCRGQAWIVKLLLSVRHKLMCYFRHSDYCNIIGLSPCSFEIGCL